jgi:hypothetical protein
MDFCLRDVTIMSMAFWLDSRSKVRVTGTVPRPKRADRPRCGAYARSTGLPCQAQALANGRCRNHGGLSTGPRTPEGRARALMNLKPFRTRQPRG